MLSRDERRGNSEAGADELQSPLRTGASDGLNAMSFSSTGTLLATANFNDCRRGARSDPSLG
jgi:hypothetical protein